MSELRINVKCATQGVHAGLPAYASEGAAAIDIRSAECVYVNPGQTVGIRTELFIEFPEGVAGLLLPRSGLGTKGIVLANTVGLIDSDYRGEIIVMAFNRNPAGSVRIKIDEGERVAQLVFFRPVRAALEQVEDINQTARGADGFGSTGRQ